MRSEADKIKFAVIGYGHIGKRHAEMISRNPEAELVAICDIRSKEELGLNELEIPVFDSINSLFNSNCKVDVVNICTANGLHSQQAINALEHGSHVVVEKPLGLKTQNCQEVIRMAKDVNRQVFCVMQNRYSPASVWIKDVVEQKLLGDVFMVEINCYWNRDHRYYQKGSWKGTKDMDGGTLFTQFSHFIDMMYWLFGDIENINAKLENFRHKDTTDFEDSGMVNFDFVNGGVGTFNYSTAVWDKNMESSITIIGSKGTVKLGGQYMDTVEHCHIEGYDMPGLPKLSSKHDYGNYKGAAANHHFIIENVIETLKGKSQMTTTAAEGLKVVDIIERIYSQKQT